LLERVGRWVAVSADIWTDLAEWRGPTVNEAGPMDEHRGVVEHIADGSFEGTIAWQRNPAAQVSSHFIIAKDGRIAQMVPANSHTAWTQQNGNGHWLSCENEGWSGESLTDAQIWANARILARAHTVYGAPLQLATSPLGQGLGHHSMGTNGHDVPTDTWTGPTWGHELCPGPAIVAQKPLIIARAVAILNGDDMTTVDLNLAQVIATIGGNDLSLRNALVSTYLRSLPDAAARFDAVLAAAHDDAETDTHIAPDSRAQLVADLLAALPPSSGGTPPTVAEIATAVCDEQDARARTRLGP
jgi:hypothetical protein